MLCSVKTILFFLVTRLFVIVKSDEKNNVNNVETATSYYMVGVSGGLQDGYPDRVKLDHVVNPDTGETVKAILLGKLFVRGYKAYLDVMESDWRQYTSPQSDVQRLINPNVFPTGCYEDANEYFVYLVDERQLLSTLMNEPRFLSISADTGFGELRHSSPLLQEIAQHEISRGGHTNKKEILVPLVTAVWFQSTALYPSPIVKVVDGARVTNYPESLALWANAQDSDRLDYVAAQEQCLDQQPDSSSTATTEKICDIRNRESYQRYWTAITNAIQQAEDTRNEWANNNGQSMGRPVWNCERYVRFGSSKQTLRLNYPFTKTEFQDVIDSLETNYVVDFVKGKIYAKQQSVDEL